jgi:SAM-dependent methyltransferase
MRLELQHRIWYITLNGKLHLAPIPRTVEDVLDVGTGTGSWATEFATAYPESQVIGSDLSPIQPTNVPPNCHFLVDDASAEWAFGRHFDYIHVRALTVGIRDWTHFFQQCWDNIRPGGWVELQEWIAPLRCDDGSCPPDSPLLKWCGYLQDAGSKAGIDFQAATKFSTQLQNQGFVNVQEIRGKWAMGTWPKGRREKRIGEMFRKDIHESVDAASMRLLNRELGWTEEEIRQFLITVRKEINNPNFHLYMPIYVIIGQRPV